MRSPSPQAQPGPSPAAQPPQRQTQSPGLLGPWPLPEPPHPPQGLARRQALLLPAPIRLPLGRWRRAGLAALTMPPRLQRGVREPSRRTQPGRRARCMRCGRWAPANLLHPTCLWRHSCPCSAPRGNRTPHRGRPRLAAMPVPPLEAVLALSLLHAPAESGRDHPLPGPTPVSWLVATPRWHTRGQPRALLPFSWHSTHST